MSKPIRPPKILYHYCSNEAFVSMASHRTIWLSSMSLSNDSMEGKWLRQLLEVECLSKGFKRRHLPEIAFGIDTALKAVDGLCFCLSEESDRLSQWRGYAGDGTGVCIGFSSTALAEMGMVKDTDDIGFTLEKVNYGNLDRLGEVQSVVDQLVLASKKGAWDMPGLLTPGNLEENMERHEREVQITNLNFAMLFMDFFKVKNPAFEEEREWRALSMRFRYSDYVCKYRPAGDKIIPYQEVGMNPLDSQLISNIILGPKNRSRVDDIKLMLDCMGFGEVDVSRSSASYQ